MKLLEHGPPLETAFQIAADNSREPFVLDWTHARIDLVEELILLCGAGAPAEAVEERVDLACVSSM